MEVRKYLEEVRKYRSIIQHKQETLERNKLTSQAVQEIENEIDQYTALQQEAIQLFEQLPLMQYEVMYQIYILGLSLQEVADRAYKSYSWATTTQGRAIKAIAEIRKES